VQLDFWHDAGEGVHVLVPPEHLERVKRHLNDNGVLYDVLNDHLQRHASFMLSCRHYYRFSWDALLEHGYGLQPLSLFFCLYVPYMLIYTTIKITNEFKNVDDGGRGRRAGAARKITAASTGGFD